MTGARDGRQDYADLLAGRITSAEYVTRLKARVRAHGLAAQLRAAHARRTR